MGSIRSIGEMSKGRLTAVVELSGTVTSSPSSLGTSFGVLIEEMVGVEDGVSVGTPEDLESMVERGTL